MSGHVEDGRLRAGWIVIVVSGVVFMVYSVVTATTPLLAEEDYVGTSFAGLQAVNPRLANIIWHDHLAFGSVNFGASLLVVILSWKGLRRGLSLAWYSLLVLGAASLAFLLLSHLPFGYSFLHFGPGLVLNAIYFMALVVSAKPVFSKQQKSIEG